MDTFIVWAADKLGQKLETAFLGDNVSVVALLNQHIQHGNSFMRGWIERAAGRVILMGGGSGAAVVPDSFLAELANLQAQISALWEDTISFGVSLSLKEAERAMRVAQERGGNRVLWYTPDLDRVPEQTNETDQLANLKPIAKGEEAEQSPNSQFMEVPQEGGEQPPQQAPESAPTSDAEQIRNIVINVLKQIKSQKKTLDQLKLQAPDTYKAVLGAVQAMIVMARGIADGGGGEGGDQPSAGASAAEQANAAQDEQAQVVDSQKEMAIGIQEEMKEHQISEAEALKLVQDHLNIDSKYYSRREGE